MQKSLLIIGLFFLSINLSFSQRVILDFEADGKTGQFTSFGADNWTDDPQFQIIANPDASGLNQSDSVGLYIEPNEGEPWQGMSYKPADFGDDLVDFTSGNTELCAKIWMASAGTFTFKAEVNSTGELYESTPPISVSTTGQWVEVCQDFAGTPVDGKMVETVVIFFNILSVPSAVTNHYFDDITQSGVSSVNTIEKSAFSVYPNPVSDVLQFKTEFDVDEVILSDMFGKTLSRSFANRQGEISMSGLPSGVYTISFTDNTGRIGTTRFVKL